LPNGGRTNEGEDAAALAKKVKTIVDPKGSAVATIGKMGLVQLMVALEEHAARGRVYVEAASRRLKETETPKTRGKP